MLFSFHSYAANNKIGAKELHRIFTISDLAVKEHWPLERFANDIKEWDMIGLDSCVILIPVEKGQFELEFGSTSKLKNENIPNATKISSFEALKAKVPSIYEKCQSGIISFSNVVKIKGLLIFFTLDGQGRIQEMRQRKSEKPLVP